MIQTLIAKEEGKTLEFKENCRSLDRIVQTAVAFANTSGGSIVIGVKDRTKGIAGVADAVADESRLANAFAENIKPLFIPDIQITSWRGRSLIIVVIPHALGPYYVRSEGPDEGVYIRLGSTNRRAGREMVAEIRRLARNTTFDEQPCPEINSEDIDFRAASELFSELSLSLTASKRRSLGLVVDYGGRDVPTNGAVLLFGKTRSGLFPDATVSCARFAGTSAARFVDRSVIDEHLPKAIESVVSFVERHTRSGAEIGRVLRRDVPEFPPEAVREAVVNAIVHADYSITGASTRVAIFDDRIEITNPGLLPFGLTMEAALSGISRLRNRVIGRTFRELHLIEQWGSGISRMREGCANAGLPPLGSRRSVPTSGSHCLAGESHAKWSAIG
jgi:predicted HTH transcriptional regulator